MIQNIIKSPKKWTLWGIPAIFAIGSGMHFLYDLLGKNPAVGAIAPVNESIWEHIKLALLPVILWWTLYYLLVGEKHGLDSRRWFAGALTATIVSSITIPAMYYFYHGATGKEWMWMDILIFLIAIAEGQLAGLHIYYRSSGLSPMLVLGILAGLVVIFILFTYYPPHIPFFYDETGGFYGIK